MLVSACFVLWRKERVLSRCADASEVLELDQHGQRALELAVEVRFVSGKLLQFVGMQSFAHGLVFDGFVVASLFFLG